MPQRNLQHTCRPPPKQRCYGGEDVALRRGADAQDFRTGLSDVCL